MIVEGYMRFWSEIVVAHEEYNKVKGYNRVGKGVREEGELIIGISGCLLSGL